MQSLPVTGPTGVRLTGNRSSPCPCDPTPPFLSPLAGLPCCLCVVFFLPLTASFGGLFMVHMQALALLLLLRRSLERASSLVSSSCFTP